MPRIKCIVSTMSQKKLEHIWIQPNNDPDPTMLTCDHMSLSSEQVNVSNEQMNMNTWA